MDTSPLAELSSATLEGWPPAPSQQVLPQRTGQSPLPSAQPGVPQELEQLPRHLVKARLLIATAHPHSTAARQTSLPPPPRGGGKDSHPRRLTHTHTTHTQHTEPPRRTVPRPARCRSYSLYPRWPAFPADGETARGTGHEASRKLP